MTQAIDTRFLVTRILGYAVVFLCVWYCKLNFKSGPCTPNLDIFSWLIATALSIILLLKNGVQLIIT